jgi:hypothetical protein
MSAELARQIPWGEVGSLWIGRAGQCQGWCHEVPILVRIRFSHEPLRVMVLADKTAEGACREITQKNYIS